MLADKELSEKLRSRIFKNTFLALLAYSIAVIIGFSSVYLKLNFYSYTPYIWISVAATLIHLGFIIVTYLKTNIDKWFAHYMLVAQIVCWFIIFSVTLFFMANLKSLMLITSIMAFAFVFSYQKLKYSIFLSLLVAISYLLTAYMGTYYFGQPGSLSYEILFVICYVPACIFIAYMGSRVAHQRNLLKITKRNLESAIIDRQNAMQQLEEVAATDDLTGLLNRRAINKILHYEYDRLIRYDTEVTLILVDIDHFKKINDNYGHDCGDLVLKTIAIAFENSIRNTDFISRWGGEEFLFVLPNTNLENSKVIVTRILVDISKLSVVYDSQPISLTVSAGVLEISTSDSLNENIKKVDGYLYKAKNKGRNCFVDA